MLRPKLFLFVYFVALCPKSTAMVTAGRSVHLTTLFSWASLNKQLTSTSLVTDNNLSYDSELYFYSWYINVIKRKSD